MIRHVFYFVLDSCVCLSIYEIKAMLNLKRKAGKIPTGVGFTLIFLTFSLLGAIWQWVPLAVAQSESGITEPASGDVVSGVVTVRGTATHPDFLRYELAFERAVDLEAGWIVFAEGANPVIDGTLAIWDTAVGQEIGAPVFPDGLYRLRLRVVKTDYNYDEYFVTNLTISNSGPTPTATPDETAVAATVTAAGATVAPVVGSGDSSFQQPTPLPSLTPFPTPTPPALPANSGGSGESAVPDLPADDGGILGDLSVADADQVTGAFWHGVRLTGYLFGALALYLLLRAGARRLWRHFWRQHSSHNKEVS